MKTKKILALILAAALALSLAACGSAQTSKDKDGLIKVGIVNNPPSESGYRAANVADFEKVFSEANGYKVSTFYSLKNDEQLNAAQQFITDGVDYLLISAAATDGWTNVLENAKKAGVKVFLFDRMMNVDQSCLRPPLSPTWKPRAGWPYSGCWIRSFPNTMSYIFREQWAATPRSAVQSLSTSNLQMAP